MVSVPVPDPFLTYVAVSSGRTVVDTEAMLALLASLRHCAEEARLAESRLARAHDLCGEWQDRAPSTTWATLATVEAARAAASALVVGLGELAEAVGWAALVLGGAEADAETLVRLRRAVLGESALPWMPLAHGAGLPWLSLGAGLRAGGVAVGPSLGLPWGAGADALLLAGAFVPPAVDFARGGGADPTGGLRVQRDMADLASHWGVGGAGRAGRAGGTGEAAARVAQGMRGVASLTLGPSAGVEVVGHVPGGGVLRRRVSAFDEHGWDTPTTGRGPGGALLGASTLLAPLARTSPHATGVAGHVPAARADRAGGAGGGVGAARPTVPPRRVRTPHRPTELLQRLSALADGRTHGQFEILEHRTPGPFGERRSWSVVIRGTQKWGVGGSNPQDMLTNLQGVGGLSSDQVRAVEAGLEMVGAAPGEPVEFVGHSQGGIVAAQLAADEGVLARHRVVSVLTAGSPTAGARLGPGVAALHLENTRDLVPSLDGLANPAAPGRLTVHFDGAALGGGAGGAFAHDMSVYREAMGRLEAAQGREGNASVAEVGEWMRARGEAMGWDERTRTTSWVMDTRRLVGER